MTNKLIKILSVSVVFVFGVFAASATMANAAPQSIEQTKWGNPPGAAQPYTPGMMQVPYNQTNPYCVGAGNANTILSMPKEDLSVQESEALAFMFEEEKLARDVYAALAEKWNGGVFSLITQAEQQHMDTIRVLLDKYAITVEELPSGEFVNSDLQALYTELVATGSENVVEAYKVGGLIEETDIRDLIDYQKTVDNQDILLVFQNLGYGSNHHLNAFSRNYQIATGQVYTPSVLTQSEYEEILNAQFNAGGGRMGMRGSMMGNHFNMPVQP